MGATEKNNGITEFYSYDTIKNSSKTGGEPNEQIERKLFEGNCICVTNDGSVGHAYYQISEFTCSHSVNPLYLKNTKLTKNLAMFLITAIEQQKVCFKFSRKWRPNRMKKTNILLPINDQGTPDYEFMEQYAKNIIHTKITEYLKFIESK